MPADKQIQKAGDRSVNIQADTIQMGISYTDARRIALDVFENNFERLSAVAANTARERATELFEEYVSSLGDANPDRFSAFVDPDWQCALIAAQKGYARSGDDNLRKLLVDLLARRSQQEGRSTLSIALTESIEVAPKLTNEQLDVLSLVLMVRNADFPVATWEDFAAHIRHYVLPFLPPSPARVAYHRHLAFTGCASLHMGIKRNVVTFEYITAHKYPGLSSQSFTREKFYETLAVQGVVGEPGKYDALLVRCDSGPDMYRLKAGNKAGLIQELKKLGADQVVAKACQSLFKPELYSWGITGRQRLASVDPRMQSLMKFWNQSLGGLTLSSVGVLLGEANVFHKTGRRLDVDRLIA